MIKYLLLLLLGISFGSVFAFDYIGNNDAIWNKSPTFCLDNNSYNKTYYAMRAIKSWNVELDKIVNDNSFDYYIHTDVNHECDVIIYNQKTNFQTKSGEALGTTKCLWNEGFYLGCIIKVDFSHEQYYSTIVHEVGHALGLGHRLPFNQTGFAGVVISNDIMMQQAGSFQRITSEDINALINFYGLDGFLTNSSNYTARDHIIQHKGVNNEK